jgi:hypothetical protein
LLAFLLNRVGGNRMTFGMRPVGTWPDVLKENYSLKLRTPTARLGGRVAPQGTGRIVWMHGSVFNSIPIEFKPDSVLIDVRGSVQVIPNDFVWIFVGGEPPHNFLKKIGVKFGPGT